MMGLKKLRETLPPLGSQRQSADPVVYAKFWIPDANWIWYVTEGEPTRKGFKFFGYVIGMNEEWEEFSLYDLEVVRGPTGQKVTLDQDFVSDIWSRVKAREHRLDH